MFKPITMYLAAAVAAYGWVIAPRPAPIPQPNPPAMANPATATATPPSPATEAFQALQPPAGPIPCPSCGTGATLPSVLRLNGVDHTGRTFTNFPLTFQTAIPPSPTYPGYPGGLRYVGVSGNIRVTFDTGVGTPFIAENAPASNLTISYAGSTWGGIGAGIMDCATRTFTTPANGPYSPFNLPAGMTVAP